MKRKILVIYALILVMQNHMIVNASSYADEWLAKKQAQQEQYLAELEADGNLTEEAIDATKLKTNKKANKKKEKKENDKNNNQGKGWVYSTDELHVINLPEDKETGYTKSGWYGNIE